MGNDDKLFAVAVLLALLLSLRRFELSMTSSSNSCRAGRLLYEDWLLLNGVCCFADGSIKLWQLLSRAKSVVVGVFWLCCDMIREDCYYSCCDYLLEEALKWFGCY